MLGKLLFRYWCWTWADVCVGGETLAVQQGRAAPFQPVAVQLTGRARQLSEETFLMDPWSFGRTRLRKKTSLVQYVRRRFQKRLSSLKHQ